MKRNADGFTDAKTNLIFRVTEHCIEVAIPGDPEHCVFAEGVRESNQKIEYVFVGPSFSRVIFADGRRLVYMTPRELRMALTAFDVFHEARVIEQGRYLLLAPTGVRSKEYRKIARERHQIRKTLGIARTYSPRQVTHREPPAVLSGRRANQWAPLPAEFVQQGV